ncbi:unnamed protein product [Amoebophrya sp. A120]|nr:unnamed protein product [Amoebophrya sp. A120]|eukprot:GSA120T00020402001.1
MTKPVATSAGCRQVVACWVVLLTFTGTLTFGTAPPLANAVAVSLKSGGYHTASTEQEIGRPGEENDTYDGPMSAAARVRAQFSRPPRLVKKVLQDAGTTSSSACDTTKAARHPARRENASSQKRRTRLSFISRALAALLLQAQLSGGQTRDVGTIPASPVVPTYVSQCGRMDGDENSPESWLGASSGSGLLDQLVRQLTDKTDDLSGVEGGETRSKAQSTTSALSAEAGHQDEICVPSSAATSLRKERSQTGAPKSSVLQEELALWEEFKRNRREAAVPGGSGARNTRIFAFWDFLDSRMEKTPIEERSNIEERNRQQMDRRARSTTVSLDKKIWDFATLENPNLKTVDSFLRSFVADLKNLNKVDFSKNLPPCNSWSSPAATPTPAAVPAQGMRVPSQLHPNVQAILERGVPVKSEDPAAHGQQHQQDVRPGARRVETAAHDPVYSPSLSDTDSYRVQSFSNEKNKNPPALSMMLSKPPANTHLQNTWAAEIDDLDDAENFDGGEDEDTQYSIANVVAHKTSSAGVQLLHDENGEALPPEISISDWMKRAETMQFMQGGMFFDEEQEGHEGGAPDVVPEMVGNIVSGARNDDENRKDADTDPSVRSSLSEGAVSTDGAAAAAKDDMNCSCEDVTPYLENLVVPPFDMTPLARNGRETVAPRISLLPRNGENNAEDIAAAGPTGTGSASSTLRISNALGVPSDWRRGAALASAAAGRSPSALSSAAAGPHGMIPTPTYHPEYLLQDLLSGRDLPLPLEENSISSQNYGFGRGMETDVEPDANLSAPSSGSKNGKKSNRSLVADRAGDSLYLSLSPQTEDGELNLTQSNESSTDEALVSAMMEVLAKEEEEHNGAALGGTDSDSSVVEISEISAIDSLTPASRPELQYKLDLFLNYLVTLTTLHAKALCEPGLPLCVARQDLKEKYGGLAKLSFDLAKRFALSNVEHHAHYPGSAGKSEAATFTSAPNKIIDHYLSRLHVLLKGALLCPSATYQFAGNVLEDAQHKLRLAPDPQALLQEECYEKELRGLVMMAEVTPARTRAAAARGSGFDGFSHQHDVSHL